LGSSEESPRFKNREGTNGGYWREEDDDDDQHDQDDQDEED
jgi:hypothetical protein